MRPPIFSVAPEDIASDRIARRSRRGGSHPPERLQHLRINQFFCVVVLVLLSTLVASSFYSPAFSQPVRRLTSEEEQEFKRLSVRGLSLFKQKEYRQSRDALKAAAKLKPLDKSVQYFLGLSAFHINDYSTAEDTLTKVVVMSPGDSKFGKNAFKCLENHRKKFHNVRPYSCTDGYHKFWRWSKDTMPIKVYISDGLQLPAKYRAAKLTSAMVADVKKLVKSSRAMSNLSRQRHFKPAHLACVKKGLAEWGWADREGFLKFRIVDNPSRADILVFWCSSLKGSGSSTTLSGVENAGPAVIQLSVEFVLKAPLDKQNLVLQSVAAHEFGHAFGLQHSNYRHDIMYPLSKSSLPKTSYERREPNIVTYNDCATLRALYSLPAPILRF